MSEIIIKTEVVKVEDLQGREKQIYEYAYRKGCEETMDVNLKNKADITRNRAVVVVFLFMAVCFLIFEILL